MRYRRGGDFQIGEARVVTGERHRELSFGNAGVGLGKIADEPVDDDLVRLRGKRAIELQERVAKRLSARGRVGEQPFEIAFEVSAHPGLAEHGDHLLGAVRTRIELLPQLGGVHGEAPLPREQGDLGRSARKRRILSVACRLVIRAGRERRLAALEREVAHEDPVHDVRAELGRGSRDDNDRWRRRGGLRRRRRRTARYGHNSREDRGKRISVFGERHA